MNLPFRNKGGAQTNPIIPEMNGPVQPTSGSRVNWPRVILALIVGVLLLGALIWGSISVSHKISNPGKTVATTSSSAPSSQTKKSTSTSSAGSSKQKPSSKSSSGSSASTGSSNPTPQTATGNSQQQTPAQSQAASGNLTNSGPGDVVGVFVVASLAGAGLYHYILRKRAA